MDNDTILIIIKLGVPILGFIIGRYILPKIKGYDLTTLTMLAKRAYQFVIEAQKAMSDKAGKEKNKFVTDQIIAICKIWGISVNTVQISAIIESAYVAMKQGENNGK